jgi:hypothetical protein
MPEQFRREVGHDTGQRRLQARDTLWYSRMRQWRSSLAVSLLSLDFCMLASWTAGLLPVLVVE